MNITLSADRQIVERTRQYAAKHGTTLNKMVRDFMEGVVGCPELDDAATEFARLARENAGCSAEGYRFDRDDAHGRSAE